MTSTLRFIVNCTINNEGLMVMNATATLHSTDAVPNASAASAASAASYGRTGAAHTTPATNANAQLNRANRLKNSENAKIVYVPQDTKLWGVQVWISFAIATFLCGVGLAYLPGQDLDRAFMVMGYFFCLSTAFVLSKYVRDNESREGHRESAKRDTPLYGAVVYVAFAAAIALTAWGLYRMTIAESYKAYLLVSWLYLITTTFTLAKTLRDRHEAAIAEAKIGGRDARDHDLSADA
jgi:hypothetical protein